MQTSLNNINAHCQNWRTLISGILDLAPDHAGLVFAVSNTAANVPGFVGPAVVGALLTDYSDTSQWYSVFSLG